MINFDFVINTQTEILAVFVPFLLVLWFVSFTKLVFYIVNTQWYFFDILFNRK